MKETAPYKNKVHLFHVTDGKIWTFNTKNDAAKYIGWIQSIGSVGVHFKECDYYDNGHHYSSPYLTRTSYKYVDLIMRDDYGDIVTIGEIYSTYRKLYKPYKPYNRYRYSTAGSKTGHYRWYRRIKTTQERREAYDNYDAYDEYGIVVKPRRKTYDKLPNTWDYIVRHNEHNWKCHRKHQWR